MDWLCRNIGWPVPPPKTILDLVHLEACFDVLDLYLWLRFVYYFERLVVILIAFDSYRFTDLFNDAPHIRDLQQELDLIIQQGVVQLTQLLKNQETGISRSAGDIDEEDITAERKKNNYLRGEFDQ